MIKFIDFLRRYRRYQKQIDLATKKVFERGQFILGPEVEEFERCFADYLGVKHVIGVNSGTDAIFFTLKALGLKKGDEVITVANTATPTVTAIGMTGATPVFVDIDEKTMLMNVDLIEKKINKKTKVILPVHLYGQPVQMGRMIKLAKKYNLKIVEDCAQAAGASYRNKKVGSLGLAGCFSFYPTKNLGAFGDGGAIATNDKILAETAKQLRNYGEASKFNNVREGFNSRLDEIQASFLNWGLGLLDKNNKSRTELAKIYHQELKKLPIILPPLEVSQTFPVWNLFTIRVNNRSELTSYLKEKGIGIVINYPKPITEQLAYHFLNYKEKDLPITYKVCQEVIALPLYPELTKKEVKEICRCLKEFYRV